MNTDSTHWTVHSSRRVYTSEWVNVDLDDVETPAGDRFDHHVLRFPRASVGAILRKDDRICLLWRHRFITNSWGWEIPAGWCDNNEESADAIAREILEETGYHAADVRPLTSYYPMTGISPQQYRLFTAVAAIQQTQPDPTETSRIGWFDQHELVQLLTEGKVSDGPSVTGLTFFLAIGNEPAGTVR